MGYWCMGVVTVGFSFVRGGWGYLYVGRVGGRWCCIFVFIVYSSYSFYVCWCRVGGRLGWVFVSCFALWFIWFIWVVCITLGFMFF